MEIDVFSRSRDFPVGISGVVISHAANVVLEPNEMVTFVGHSKREYDVVAKDWGFYATPSVGGRLRSFGIRAALMRNVDTRHVYVVLVYDDRHEAWERYLEDERQELVCWLDEI